VYVNGKPPRFAFESSAPVVVPSASYHERVHVFTPLARWINPETAKPEYRIVDGAILILINPGMAATKKAPPKRG
jgi:hypothetical protein